MTTQSQPQAQAQSQQDELALVLQELARIKQVLAAPMLPAIPLDAFLELLRETYHCSLAKRTAQGMIADGRIPIMPKLRATDMPWVNLARWREMAADSNRYMAYINENRTRR
ncbi:MAG: hypothetical protein ACRC9V_11340 [Aeromonas sp.]